MTDTGRIPGEGRPENAGPPPGETPGEPASSAYAFADAEDDTAGVAPEDEELLMPSPQGAWGDAPPTTVQPRPPQQATPAHGTDTVPPRPPHLGPPEPEQSGTVRPLSERAQAPASATPARPTPVAAPVPQPRQEDAAPPDPQQAAVVDGPEYLDAARPEPSPRGESAGLPAESGGWETAPAASAHEGEEQSSGQEPTVPPGPLPGAGQPVDVAAVRSPEQAAVPAGTAPGISVDGPVAEAAPSTAGDPAGPAEPAPEAAPQDEQPAVSGESDTAGAVPAPAEEPYSADAAEQPALSVPAAGTPVADAGREWPAETSPAPAEVPGAAAAAPEGTVAEAGQQAGPAADPAGDAAPEGGATAAPVAEPAADPAVPAATPGEETAPEAVAPPAEAGVAEAPSGEAVTPERPGSEETPVGAPVSGAPASGEPETPGAAAGTDGSATGTATTASGAEAPAPAEEPAAGFVAPEAGAPAPVAAVAGEETAEPVQQPVEETATPAAEAPVAAAPVAAKAPQEPAGPQPAPEGAPAPAGEEDATAPAAGNGTADGVAPAGGTPADGTAASGAPGEDAPDRPAEPAPGYAEADRETVHRLMRERRDIRNGFRNDPIPDDVLLRVLEAAHTAPSVGHSQPWDFVVIRSADTRRRMHELAVRQREAYARSLPKARAKQFKELKIEAILDTPVNIVVTADPTRGGRHTLGRHTQPQMAPYSSALAVENLWLAARAEGLGVGWVSFFDEREMVHTLELPGHMEVVAYLCVGYVDEFPPEPELAQAGWSKRRPLSWVVHEESYGRRVLPGAEQHDLLSETVDAIRPLDAKALGEAWERQKRMTKPAGALGMLEIISAQLCGLSRQCPPPLPEPAAVAVFAGDHGVHAQGVTPWPQEVTGQMVRNLLDGGAVCNSFANQVGAEVCIVDVGVKEELPSMPGLLPRKVRAGTADMTAGPALTREEAKRAVEAGIETARDLVTAGNKALLTGEMGIANTTASAALISACTGQDPAEITGRGTGINDETHARKVEIVRRALELHRPDPKDPIGMLAAVGGLEHAAMVGLILGGAAFRTPVVLDGVSAGAAALVARALAPEALAACIAGHRSAEPGHVAALNTLGLRPLVDLDLRLGEGTGALLALPMVQSAARAMHEVATFDTAGVTEKE